MNERASPLAFAVIHDLRPNIKVLQAQLNWERLRFKRGRSRRRQSYWRRVRDHWMARAKPGIHYLDKLSPACQSYHFARLARDESV